VPPPPPQILQSFSILFKFVLVRACVLGPGMLSLPFALSHAGYVVGTTCLMGFALCSIFGVMYVHTLSHHFSTHIAFIKDSAIEACNDCRFN
jgi:amino acid permease